MNLSEKSDIAALKIAVIQDSRTINSALNAGADEKNLIIVLTAEDAIKMVDDGSVDAFAYGDYPGQKAIATYAKNPDKFSQQKEIGYFKDYFAFNPDTPEEFVTSVNDTLKELKMNRAESGSTDYEKIFLKYLPIGCMDSDITDERLVDLVQKTIENLKGDPSGTLTSINAGESPYVDSTDPNLYVFVFDTNVTLLANAVNPQTVGTHYSGKPDAVGNMFRDNLTELALKEGKGWITYVYSNPESLILYKKKSYVELCTDSDGVRYIVGSGRYLNCSEMKEEP
ncbi:cache domain-containing protein [Methanospirillum stamsii]|uniref:cache domain-containing protein n=1 Tax=Methanospirillum stamsii TaxID=1277351 RepID=UPI0015E82E67|nr:cache domain-containing protein [Methanospirillum stamsii]